MNVETREIKEFEQYIGDLQQLFEKYHDFNPGLIENVARMYAKADNAYFSVLESPNLDPDKRTDAYNLMDDYLDIVQGIAILEPKASAEAGTTVREERARIDPDYEPFEDFTIGLAIAFNGDPDPLFDEYNIMDEEITPEEAYNELVLED